MSLTSDIGLHSGLPITLPSGGRGLDNGRRRPKRKEAVGLQIMSRGCRGRGFFCVGFRGEAVGEGRAWVDVVCWVVVGREWFVWGEGSYVCMSERGRDRQTGRERERKRERESVSQNAIDL